MFNYLEHGPKDKTNLKTMSGLNWMFSVIDRPCPNRKIGRFRHLKKLNEKVITIYDIFRITGIRNKYEFIVNAVEEKVKEKIKKMERNQKKYDQSKRNKAGLQNTMKKLPVDKNVVMDTNYYLERYKKRQKKMEQKFEPVMFVGFDKGHFGEESNYLKVIFKID